MGLNKKGKPLTRFPFLFYCYCYALLLLPHIFRYSLDFPKTENEVKP